MLAARQASAFDKNLLVESDADRLPGPRDYRVGRVPGLDGTHSTLLLLGEKSSRSPTRIMPI